MTKLPCPPELWPAFSALLDEALELAESERPRWLSALGAEHAAVRPWLVRVIARDGNTVRAGFMESPSTPDPAPEFSAGQVIGPYVLERPLGSGGMGEVWLAARRDGMLNRQVALKLPYSHIIAGVLRRRFERERDILAALSHPHIAQLYDAGVAESKYPYLSMEWVDGVELNQHCAAAKLTLDHRLDLFLQILDAVGYAHGRLIAHRDLKPSNILVTKQGRIKLLDFGIAKLLSTEADSGSTQLTRIGSCMATPGYAAPEQLAGEPITAAVDLYALGVVLHELLTGGRPHRDARKAALERTDAGRASSHIEPDHAVTVGGLTSKQLRRALSGDLDAIIAKALEFDPARRYSSAELFALDIRHSRRHRPISARRVGAATLAGKFVRRHWIGVGMSAALLLVLIGGSAGIAWQAVRAEREAQRATTIKDFLVGVFRASDPRIASDKPRGEITARDLLDVSAKRIEVSFARQPETQVELLGITADIYRELEETQRSNALYARETEIASKYYGAANAHVIDGLLGQADNADKDGDDARSLALLAQADPLIRDAHLDGSPIRARWLLMKGEALFDDPAKGDEAQWSLEAAANLFKSAAPEDPRYPDAYMDLGALTQERSRFADSARNYQKAISIALPNVELRGDLMLASQGLAVALERLGDFKGAAAAFETGTDLATRTYGRDSQHYWAISSDWALFRYERGDREAALDAFETLVRNLPAATAPFRNATDALEAAEVLRKYGYCLAVDGQGPRAVQLLEQARGLLTNSAAHAFDVGRLESDLGIAYQAVGRTEDARAAYSAALMSLQLQNAPPARLARALERWGEFLAAQHRLADAENAFNETLRLSEDQGNESAIYARVGLAMIAVSRGDAHAALDASSQAMNQLAHIKGDFDIRIEPTVWATRARSLFLAGDTVNARILATRAREAVKIYYSPGSSVAAGADALARNFPE